MLQGWIISFTHRTLLWEPNIDYTTLNLPDRGCCIAADDTEPYRDMGCFAVDQYMYRSGLFHKVLAFLYVIMDKIIFRNFRSIESRSLRCPPPLLMCVVSVRWPASPIICDLLQQLKSPMETILYELGNFMSFP